MGEQFVVVVHVWKCPTVVAAMVAEGPLHVLGCHLSHMMTAAMTVVTVDTMHETAHAAAAAGKINLEISYNCIMEVFVWHGIFMILLSYCLIFQLLKTNISDSVEKVISIIL